MKTHEATCDQKMLLSVLRPALIGALTGLMLATSALAASPEQRGKSFARQHCSRCHAIGLTGESLLTLKPGLAPSEDIRKRVEDSVIREMGAIARPRRVVIVPDMPKTRSGKIMRRVLGAISNNEDAGDISTLANPEIVDEIRKMKS
jgi:hypothetical protein